MVYRCKNFDTLSDLTRFLNENNILKDDIIYIGPEYGPTNSSRDWCLIYFKRSW